VSETDHTTDAPPWAFVRDRVCVKGSGFTPTQRLVARLIADRLNADGEWAMGFRDIADRGGIDVKTVGRAVKGLCDGSNPVFARQRTRYNADGKIQRGCYRYTVVRNVRSFTAARDRGRLTLRQRAESIIGKGRRGHAALTADDQALQLKIQETKQELTDRWGSGKLSDAEYHEELSRLELAVYKRLGVPYTRPA